MKADETKILWLLDNTTQYRISKETGISQGNLSNLVHGRIQLGNLTFKNASAMTELAEKMQKE